MTADSDIRIIGEPMPIPSMCRFVVDRPVLPDRSCYFGNQERAQESPLAHRLFHIDGISSVLLSHDRITLTQSGMQPWQVIGKQIGAAIRAHLQSAEPAVNESYWERLPSEEEIRKRVQRVLDEDLNPALAGHGGFVRLVDVRDNAVTLQLGGGCQGCSMATFTLKQGVEVALRDAIPELGDIVDVTDHSAGRNPYQAAH
jgi:Fe-S cluster biogenesis protein NfuA